MPSHEVTRLGRHLKVSLHSLCTILSEKQAMSSFLPFVYFKRLRCLLCKGQCEVPSFFSQLT